MKRAQLVFVICTVWVFLFVGIALLSFNTILESHKYEEIEKRLQESVEPNVVSFNLQMDEQMKKVKTFAGFLGENWDAEEGVHLSLLQAAVKNNGLLRCALAYRDGSFITHDSKNEGNVSNDAFFLANMRGETMITDPRPAVVDQTKTVILFSAPIYDQNNQILGSVIYSYLCDDLDKIFNLKSFGGQMNMVVAKQTGELLIGDTEYAPKMGNLISNFREGCTHKGHDPKACVEIIGISGSYILSDVDSKEDIYVRYDKLGFGDWYLVATIDEEVAGASISFAAENQQNLSLCIGLGIMVYFIILFVLWRLQKRLFDSRTGALTLNGFKKRVREIFRNNRDQTFVVVKLDVKDFKLINRIHSFAVGDRVIKSMAQALQYVLEGQNCAYAHVGIDSFLLLLPYEGRDSLNAKRQVFTARFREIMEDSFSSKVVFPTGQYVLKPEDFPHPDIDEIYEKVNFAHRAAKQNSDIVIDYHEDIEHAAIFEKTVEDRMESAITDGEFALYLQPKIQLSDESLYGAEALVRWKIGDKYYMYPTDFIPVLEKNGFIVQLDFYMFKCAVQYIKGYLDQGVEPIPISVNFSRHHLNNEDFVSELCRIADMYEVPHKYLEVEITESAFLGHIEDIIRLINRLHAAGFLFSMDDFGSGYSCFAQLKDLQVDTLKIDKGFFSEGGDPARGLVIITGIIEIAQNLHITTVAEGIEHREQMEMLKELGCDIIQGYYYAKPIPANELDIVNFVVTRADDSTQE